MVSFYWTRRGIFCTDDGILEDKQEHVTVQRLPDKNRRLAMKYTPEERLDIGRQIYDGELSRYEAAEQYGIGEQTARNYMRMYRDANHLPPKRGKRAISAPSFKTAPSRTPSS